LPEDSLTLRHAKAKSDGQLVGFSATTFQGPLRMSKGMAGYAFWDRDERLIVIAGNNLRIAPGAMDKATVTLQLKDGDYRVRDLLGDR
jgi:hypothetical protein